MARLSSAFDLPAPHSIDDGWCQPTHSVDDGWCLDPEPQAAAPAPPAVAEGSGPILLKLVPAASAPVAERLAAPLPTPAPTAAPSYAAMAVRPATALQPPPLPPVPVPASQASRPGAAPSIDMLLTAAEAAFFADGEALHEAAPPSNDFSDLAPEPRPGFWQRLRRR